MPLNLIKAYDDLLEVGHYNPKEREESLRRIFDRDFNDKFSFKGKIIRPTSIDGKPSLDTVFHHLTTRDAKDEHGAKNGRAFEMQRSIRLHWINHLLKEPEAGLVDVFSYEDRVDKKDVVRTYIYNSVHSYVIILEPQRSGIDYYILTAYYLNEPGSIKQIEKKSKKRLPGIH